MEPWSPVEYYLPAPEDPYWEENRGTSAADDTEGLVLDDGTDAIQAQAINCNTNATFAVSGSIAYCSSAGNQFNTRCEDGVFFNNRGENFTW